MNPVRVLAFVLAATSLYGGAAILVRRRLPGPSAERALATVLLGTFAVLALLRALGAIGLLNAPLLIVGPTLVGAALAWAGGARSFGDLIPLVAPRPSSAKPLGRVVLALSGAAVVFLIAALVAQAWLYRSIAWDALWYHGLMTHAYVTRASTAWIASPVSYVSGYPNGVELLTAWPCAVIGTTTFDDVGQLPFGIAGACMVVAWSERAGARRELAMTAAAAWLAMPPVFLQLTSNLNDVAEAVALAATLYFLFVAKETPLRSWLVLVSASLAYAMKGSANVLLLPFAPFLVRDQLLGAWRQPKPVLGVLARTALLVGVGLWKPIENWLHEGNPFWPVRARILGHTFDGPVDPASFVWNGMNGLDCYFFTGEGDFERMVRGWYDLHPPYEPSVTSGGFGPVHAFLGVPALALGLLLFVPRLRRASWRPLAFAYLLFVFGLMGTSPWWPRYILPASFGSMIVLATVLSRAPRRLGQTLALVTLVVAGVVLQDATSSGIFGLRDHGLLPVLQMTPPERAALVSAPLADSYVISLRDGTFGPDDALAYDSETWLVGQYVPWDYGSRLVWIEPPASADEYLAQLRAQNVRWVLAREGTTAARHLRRLHARRIHAQGAELVLEVPPR